MMRSHRSISPATRHIYLLAAAIVLGIAFAIMVIIGFANTQLRKAEQDWYARLDIIADSRTKDVNSWLQTHFADLSALANNASLQLYLTEINAQTGEMQPDDIAQQTYLRHLLTLTAQRSGYENQTQAIPANVRHSGSEGIAILNRNGEMLVSTSLMPPLEGALQEFVLSAPKGKQQLYDIRAKGDGTLEIGFLIPIYAVQGELTPSAQIGSVLAIKTLTPAFFQLLHQPGKTEASLSAFLLRKHNNRVEVLNAAPPLSVRVSADMPDSAEAQAVKHPNTHGSLASHSGSHVMFTSREITGAPWVLMQKVDREEALSAAIKTRNNHLLVLFAVLFAVLCSILLAWRHGVSRNAVKLSKTLNRTIQEIRLRENMLKLVTENHPGVIFLLDQQNHLRYANEEFFLRYGISEKDALNKELGSIIGPAEAAPYRNASLSASENNCLIHWTQQATDKTNGITVRNTHIPIDDIAFTHAPMPGVLVIEKNITSIVKEREQRERVLKQLTDSLVKIVDQRDPYAANHSAKVEVIAHAVAEHLNLDKSTVDVTAMAARLMNIGKITVPEGVLTKSSGLNQGEKTSVQNSLLRSADMIAEVEFEGPVVETLRQALEHVDGSGPKGLKGEEILISARIIAAANAFVGMTNIRAYREAMSFADAQNILLEQIDSKYDRKVVFALINYIENHDGKAALMRIGSSLAA